MKVIALKVLGSDRVPFDLVLSPGMTTEDLLAGADLANYVLVRQADPLKYLLPQEVLFDLLEDCEMLYTYAPVCEVY
jgi:hypothetical protein